MKLTITFHNVCRPHNERVKLETEFRDDMLDYCPDPVRLERWQRTKHWEYSRAY